MSDFVDANVLVYLVSNDPKRDRALEIMDKGPDTGVQALNEMMNVMRRKLEASPDQMRDASDVVRDYCQAIHPVVIDDHVAALQLMPRYGLSWWDSVLIATALRAGATRFLSEDGRDGLIVDGRLAIINPFRT